MGEIISVSALCVENSVETIFKIWEGLSSYFETDSIIIEYYINKKDKGKYHIDEITNITLGPFVLISRKIEPKNISNEIISIKDKDIETTITLTFLSPPIKNYSRFSFYILIEEDIQSKKLTFRMAINFNDLYRRTRNEFEKEVDLSYKNLLKYYLRLQEDTSLYYYLLRRFSLSITNFNHLIGYSELGITDPFFSNTVCHRDAREFIYDFLRQYLSWHYVIEIAETYCTNPIHLLQNINNFERRESDFYYNDLYYKDAFEFEPDFLDFIRNLSLPKIKKLCELEIKEVDEIIQLIKEELIYRKEFIQVEIEESFIYVFSILSRLKIWRFYKILYELL
jgi:hypothetical protein